jgi:uncharacterized protein YuzE
MEKRYTTHSSIEVLKRISMKIKYFSDSDTALMEFNENLIDSTLEVSENIYIDVDKNGRVVNITIEHAKESMRLPEFSYQEIAKSA